MGTKYTVCDLQFMSSYISCVKQVCGTSAQVILEPNIIHTSDMNIILGLLFAILRSFCLHIMIWLSAPGL